MDNSFDEQMERYKRQMLHFYKIGKQRSPEPEAVPAVASPPSSAPDPPAPPAASEQPANPPAQRTEPAPQPIEPQQMEQQETLEQEDLRDPEEIMEDLPRPEPERPQIDGITFEEAGNEALEEYLRQNPKIGFLKMQVFTARGAIPLQGAQVKISRRIGEQDHVFSSAITDRDGLIPPIPLPAPDRSLSEEPENQGEPVPFATYNIRTEYPGHVTVENFNVPIFDGIVSIQPVSMTPNTNGNMAPEEIYEQEPEDL